MSMAATLADIVNGLNLLYPVSEIAQKTGYSKGIVSNFINNKKPPTKAFLKKFNEMFNIDVKKDEVLTSEKELPEILGEHEERLIKLESYMEVFEKELASFQNNGNIEKQILTLREKVRFVAERRFHELKK